MRLRWLLFDHFPDGIDLSPEVRIAVRKLARQHRAIEPTFMNARRSGARFTIIWIVLLSLAYTAFTLLPLISTLIPKGGPAQIISHMGGMLVFQGLIWVIIALGARRSYAPYYRQALCDLGYPVCTQCGYVLRGLSGHARCPECGSDLVWLGQPPPPAVTTTPPIHPPS